jgi:hypothetical protein
MKSKFRWIGFLTLIFLSINNAHSVEDLDQVIAGGEIEDALSKVEPSKGTEPYIINSGTGDVESVKIKKDDDSDYVFKKRNSDLTVKNDEKKKLEDVGYVPVGTFEKSENYIELDKAQMATEFRNKSSSAFSISFIKNNYNYTSRNDVINRTIGEGYRHIKGGTLHLRSDQYFLRKDFVNLFWMGGAGVGFNSGRAIFVSGERSETTFRLWEIPVDIGLGLEIPLYHWFKVVGAVGPTGMVLYQNRNDYQRGESGKNKIQVSYGQFASAQFKINLSGMSKNLSYDLFSESKITNLLMNLEMRYHNYQNFQDEIKVSGTSVGLGFTFEYL